MKAKQSFDFLDLVGQKRPTKTKAPTALSKVLEVFGAKMVEQMRKNLIKDDSIATGKLLASIRFAINVSGNKSYKFQIMLEDYYQDVDKGQNPGNKTSMEAILKWIKNKPNVMIRSGVRNNDTKQRALADIISQKIRLNGTKGTNFFTKVINDKSLKSLKDEIKIATGKDMRIVIKIIKDDIGKS